MITIPEKVKAAWSAKETPIILTTVSKNGIPNSIYATCVELFDDNKVLIANNKFKKTYDNIMDCDKATVLFIANKREAYQLKGTISYTTEGECFDDMKKWNRKDLPGFGVAVLQVKEIYAGAEKVL